MATSASTSACAIAWALLTLGCGDGRPAPATPTPVRIDAGTVAAVDAGPEPVTEAECAALADHMLAVGVAEQRLDRPEERVATPEQVATIRAGLVAEMTPACLTFPREVLACAMAASSTDGIAACTIAAPSS
ncbi:MAG: hypothetical protein R2939_19575 [Kofleriaceae bacterium]